MQILLAEDESGIAHSLQKSFVAEGHQIKVASDGQEALDYLAESSFDILLLDWRMPRLSGIEVCKRLRQAGNNIPIILLTALADVSNKVEALNLGADDYITKPFSFEEVYARMQALLRRTQGEAKRVTFGKFYLDLLQHTVNNNEDEPIKLAEMEFELLCYLVENKNLIVSKEQLAKDVWKLPFLPNTNFIESTMKNLRKKIGPWGLSASIKTIYGEGYSFIDDSE